MLNKFTIKKLLTQSALTASTLILLGLSSCGGGSSSDSKVTYISDYYKKLGENTYCAEIGINDNALVSLICSEESTNFISNKLVSISLDGDIKEYSPPRPILEGEYINYSAIKNNGTFNVTIGKAFLIDDLPPIQSPQERLKSFVKKAQEKANLKSNEDEKYIWTKYEYVKIDTVVLVASDSGKYRAALSDFDTDFKYYLIEGYRQKELTKTNPSISNVYITNIINSGKQYGIAYNQGEGDNAGVNMAISWSKDGQEILDIPVSTPETLYNLLDVNNSESILYQELNDSLFQSNKTKLNVRNSKGEIDSIELDNSFLYRANINDKDVILIQTSNGNYIKTKSNGLQKLEEVAPLGENETYAFISELNNNNEILTGIDSGNGSYRTAVVKLGL